MQHSPSPAVGLGFGLLFLAGIFVVALAFYVFYCFCSKRICEKAGREPGILIWIPFVHFIPLLQVAGMAEWMVILLLIPFVNIVILAIMFAKICNVLGKSPALVVMLFIPVVNLAFLPYLAFSE